MKVYIIMKGEYSDKHICGVTLDPDIAEKIKKLCTGEWDYCEPEIHEYETDIWQFLPQGAKLYDVTFYNDGRIHGCKMITEDSDHYESYIYENNIHDSVIWEEDRHEHGLHVRVLAFGQAHAKKIACDKRAEYLAMEEGI